MKPMKIIEETIDSAARSFDKALDRVYPALGNNGFNERNLSSQIGAAFCETQGRHAFYEVPFRQNGSESTCHFDAVMFSAKCCIIVESKRLYHTTKNAGIIADIARIRDNRGSIQKMFWEEAPPKFLGLVIAEAWESVAKPPPSGSIAAWWVEGTGKKKWIQEGYPKNWHYASRMVHRFEKDEYGGQHELHWLYGYGVL